MTHKLPATGALCAPSSHLRACEHESPATTPSSLPTTPGGPVTPARGRLRERGSAGGPGLRSG